MVHSLAPLAVELNDQQQEEPVASRTDANQKAIVAGLRAVGATVQDLHAVRHGCPDIAVGFRGATYLIELKTDNGSLTDDEDRWIFDWRGQVAIAYTLADALAIIGAVEYNVQPQPPRRPVRITTRKEHKPR